MTIRAAVTGLGWWGKHMIRRMKDADGDLRIVKAIDNNPAAGAFAIENGVPFESDFATAIKDPNIDAVILCTPHGFHTQQVAMVAAAGKHCFCEKPLALTRADAEASIAACKKAGVQLGIGHERRYERAMEEALKIIKSGKLGTIMHVEATFNHDKLANVPQGDWRMNPKDAPAAGMTGMGVHLTDLYLSMFGPISEVYAATTSRVKYKENGDVVSAILRFESGATGYFNAVLVTALYNTLTVFGEHGWLEVMNETHPDTPGNAHLTVQMRDGERVTHTYQWMDTVRANLEAFGRACMGKGTYRFTDVEKIGNVAVLEAVAKSVATKAPVAIAPIKA